MAEIIIPAIVPDSRNPLEVATDPGYAAGAYNTHSIDMLYHNVVPVQTKDNEWSIATRPNFVLEDDNSGTAAYGLGCFAWESQNAWLVQDNGITTYYYNNGLSSQNLSTVTFDETKTATWCMAQDGSGSDRLVFSLAGKDGTNAGVTFYADTYTGTATEITNVNKPGKDGEILARGCVFLNGRLYLANVKGQIHNSSVNDVATWAALDFVTAERVADQTMYLGLHRDHIVAIGTNSIEFFYDDGSSSGSPLQRRADIFHNIGCVDANSVIEVGDSIYFIGRDKKGNIKLYELVNFQLTEVPSTMFNHLLGQLEAVDPSFVYSDSQDNAASHSLINVNNSGLFYVSSFGLTNNDSIRGTYALHLETGIVSKWYVGSDPTDGGGKWGDTWSTYEILPFVQSTLTHTKYGSSTRNKAMLANGVLVDVGQAGAGDLTDFGLTAPEAFFYTNPIDFNTFKKKRINNIRILHYPNLDDSIDPSNMDLEWFDMKDLLTSGIKDADSTMFTNTRTLDLSTTRAIVYRCGVTRQRIFKITLTPDKKQLIKGMQIEYEVLRN